MAKILDCIIIGGGPAGLAAGNILSKENIDFIVIEKGAYLYQRSPLKPKDIVTGVGGGGLYSDGKLSFYPSGSSLYRLKKEFLLDSYNHLSKVLSLFSIQIPEFQQDWESSATETINNDVHNKKYDSTVLSESELFNLGFYLYDQIGRDRMLVNHEVTSITKDGNIFIVNVLNEERNQQRFKCRNIIYAGGKFGSLGLTNMLGEHNLTFKKYEVGVRVETNHHDFDFNDLSQTDLKLLIKKKESPGIEFRTFCFCRNGYIVHGNFEGINSFNGVSNKPAFSKTNFGINLRISDESVYKDYQSSLSKLSSADSIIQEPIKNFLAQKNENWDIEIYELFKNCLFTYFPKLSNSDAEITGPSFEYFGYYPKLNDELKLHESNFWIAGDSTGEFRGLLPALVSGFIVGKSLVNRVINERDQLNELVRIKTSLTTKSQTIFTAQSKKFFYCKDAICEFVFKEGAIPVNPFQVFGYFLGDRVDRDLVRKGNNELIGRCDELWVFGPIADGVLFEISRAYELKMPVRFFNVDTYAGKIEEIMDSSKLIFEPEVYAQIGKEKLIRFIERSYEGEIKRKPQLSFFDGISKE